MIDTERRRGGCLIAHLFKRRKRQSSEEQVTPPANNEQTCIVDATWLSSNLVECPICCLSYPLNTNWTSCCSQPMCTFCFLHLRFPPSGRGITCPFCNGSSFGVKYYDPRLLSESGMSEKALRGEEEGLSTFSTRQLGEE